MSTYNRAGLLTAALETLILQRGDVPYEIIVVDNNSTDRTPDVVKAVAREAAGRLRYLFEPRQGLSYARNTGIVAARGAIVALTDDDVRVAPDWIEQISAAFERHPDIDYVGGRVLPGWREPPPAWLTTSHWSPLALQDYGAAPMRTGRAHAICLVGANLAFRHRVFETVGLFSPDLGRIKDGIGSTEDHEMQLRIWRAGMIGLYTPAIVAVADVTPDRMVRSYHRRWHRGHGRHCALMRLRELVPADLGPMSEPDNIVTLFGAPAFVYVELLRAGYHFVGASCRRADALFYANQVRHVWSYLGTSREMFRATTRRSPAAEVVAFARAYLRKHRRLRSNAVGV